VSAYNSYGEGSQSTSYAYATTSSATSSISLSSGTWYSNTLAAGATHYYSFYAYSGTTYTVYWEDADSSNSSYTGDIRVSATTSGGTYLLNNVDIGYSGQDFSVSSSGYITLIVTGYTSLSSGPYRIKYN
jgi:hypothetical protein